MDAWWIQENTITGSQTIGDMTVSNESGSLAELSTAALEDLTSSDHPL